MPPPGSWHFPPEPAGPQAGPQPLQESGAPGPPPDATQPCQAQPPPGAAWPGRTPGGISQPYGTQGPYGPQPPYGPKQPAAAQSQPNGGPHPHGAPPPYGTSPYYGTRPQQGAPQQYGPPYGAVYPSYPAGLAVGAEPGLAEWWRRLLGRIIDILVLSVLTAPIAFALLSPALTRYQQSVNRYPDLSQPGAQAAISKADARLFGAWLVFAAIVAVISFCYDSIQHGLWGRTLGKRALGTRVVSGYDRSKISGGTAAGRAAVYSLIPVVPLVGSVFWLLDALWLTWDRRRQCLHDKAARTIVVKTGSRPAASQQARPW